MKIIKYLFASALILLIAVSCNKGIDPIEEVAPKPDASDPTLQILYPIEGKIVRSDQEVATIVIKLVAVDDVELKSVIVHLDGAEIASYTTFKDYRRALIEYPYTNLTDGDHTLRVIATDLAGKTIEKTLNFKKVTVPVYNPLEGETLYLPFEESLIDGISGETLSLTGTANYVEGKSGTAFVGAPDSYITMPSAGIATPEFSVAFWYAANAEPARAGVIAISPEGDDRKVGFRLLREGNATEQKLGLNFGIGTTEIWMNPFVTFAPEGQWMHVAITISSTKATIYVDGLVVAETEIATPLDWTGCPSMTISSGVPNFAYWEHFSDQSSYDEMHFFSRAISAAEVQGLMGSK
ncbi:MAG: hypothetical protein FD155_2462 [Bacteroidetes bacterium]|nr:MAG: hypothetical protein FD155_2462 [Bacteroidota bacterium]